MKRDGGATRRPEGSDRGAGASRSLLRLREGVSTGCVLAPAPRPRSQPVGRPAAEPVHYPQPQSRVVTETNVKQDAAIRATVGATIDMSTRVVHD